MKAKLASLMFVVLALAAYFAAATPSGFSDGGFW